MKEDKNSRDAIPDENAKCASTADRAHDSFPLKDSHGKLCTSEDNFRGVVHQDSLGIFHFDPNGIVTECNDRIIEIWGSAREKFMGFNLLSSLKNKKMKIAVKTCLSGRHASYEGHYLSVTGGRITTLKANYSPIFSAAGTVAGGMAIIEELSESKESENHQESDSLSPRPHSQLLTTRAKERTQIARVLNDCITSPLSGIISSLESALQLAGTTQFDPESLRRVIAKMQRVVEESHRITMELRPGARGEHGLNGADAFAASE